MTDWIIDEPEPAVPDERWEHQRANRADLILASACRHLLTDPEAQIPHSPVDEAISLLMALQRRVYERWV